jgi:hypothetical protein
LLLLCFALLCFALQYKDSLLFFLILLFLTFRLLNLNYILNTPASYSGDPRFKSRPGDRTSWLRSLLVFLRPSKRMAG